MFGGLHASRRRILRRTVGGKDYVSFPFPFLGSRGAGKALVKESTSVLQFAEQLGVHYAASAI